MSYSSPCDITHIIAENAKIQTVTVNSIPPTNPTPNHIHMPYMVRP